MAAVLAVDFLRRRGLIGTGAVRDAIHAHPVGCAALVALLFAVGVLNLVRYHLALRAVGADAPLSASAPATAYSAFVSLFLPGSAAMAEAIRVGILATPPRRVSVAQATSASFVDRLLGFVGLFAVSSACLFALRYVQGQHVPAWAGFAAAGCAMACAMALCLFFVRGSRFRRWPRLASWLDALSRCLPREPLLLLPVALGVLLYVLIAAAYVLALRLCGAAPNAVGLAAALPAVVLAGLLPANVAGVGLAQVAAASVARFAMAAPEEIVAAGLLVAAATIAAQLLLALAVFLFAKKHRPD